jgi:hypothetical protein
MKSFSDTKPEDGGHRTRSGSPRTGVKDLDTLVQRTRDTEKAFRESGKVKVPGKGATPAEIKAFREAVGAPETAEGYAEGLKMPEGAPEGPSSTRR